jgi:hypothetical protein
MHIIFFLFIFVCYICLLLNEKARGVYLQQLFFLKEFFFSLPRWPACALRQHSCPGCSDTTIFTEIKVHHCSAVRQHSSCKPLVWFDVIVPQKMEEGKRQLEIV